MQWDIFDVRLFVFIWFCQMSSFDMVPESCVIPADMKLKIGYNDLESTDASSKCVPVRRTAHTVSYKIAMYKAKRITHTITPISGARITFALSAIYGISLGVGVTQPHSNSSFA